MPLTSLLQHMPLPLRPRAYTPTRRLRAAMGAGITANRRLSTMAGGRLMILIRVPRRGIRGTTSREYHYEYGYATMDTNSRLMAWLAFLLWGIDRSLGLPWDFEWVLGNGLICHGSWSC